MTLTIGSITAAKPPNAKEPVAVYITRNVTAACISVWENFCAASKLSSARQGPNGAGATRVRGKGGFPR